MFCTKLAIWFGNESRGISDEAVQRSEACISIPMFGMIESLNLGILDSLFLTVRSYQSQK